MKTIRIILLLTLSTLSLHAQKLKITALDASIQRLYDERAPYTLGKMMTIQVFDNSASIAIDTDKPMFLRKSSDNTYTNVSNNESKTETYTYTLKLYTSFSVLTSAQFSWNVQENKGQYRSAYWKLTAKRF
ncbi:hypothetical protein [Mucilaginibacter lappiensis]|uniref:Uncharacterized protein n=1 Tax=Mucilaginibacter lappiensis TaxID=354630 RepID=A0A841JG68_9SPHI|nr:hypothetical protein [Mucilaginibacter lappiensis]MBB6130149.1 hypothetical protein [Mucilaginibacter lappiensis]